MMIYPEPSPLSAEPALTDEATLKTTIDCLIEHLPMEMQGLYSQETLFEILLRAASKHDSIEQTTKSLTGSPTGNAIHYHLDKLDNMLELEQQINAALQSRLPSGIGRKKHCLAIDLHLIPYYGKPTAIEKPYIYRSQAKAGTTSFFAYATVYGIRRHKRVTLAIHAVPQQETLVATLTYLLSALSPRRIGIKQLLLDRGFFSVPVIRWLKALDIPFLMPAIVRGKQGGTRQLLQGRKSYATPYTLKSQVYGSVVCDMRIVCRYLKGRRGKHGIDYFLYVVHRVKVSLSALHQHYRARFGIETSCRIKNLCRIRTTTKNPVARFLFVALAFILVNLWIYLLWCFVSIGQCSRRVVYPELFSLKTMLEFLSHAVERHFPIITAIFLPALE
jgi:putative transposase